MINEPYIPDLVILEATSLPRLRESLYRSYEHLPDGVTPGLIEEEISEGIDKMLQCLEMRDVAPQSIQDLFEEQCQHDVEFDQGQYLYAHRWRDMARELLNQCHAFGMYYGGEYLPFFYKEQMGHDAIILQRVGYCSDD